LAGEGTHNDSLNATQTRRPHGGLNGPPRDVTVLTRPISGGVSAAGHVDRDTNAELGNEKTVVPATLMKHYFSGNGSPFKIDIVPEEWQEWIVVKTGGKPGVYPLDPYTKDGPYSLRHSLGHFNVTLTRTVKDTLYTIQDYYEFGYIPNDIDGKQRHGINVSDLGWSQDRIDSVRRRLPTKKFPNPGCGEEEFKFETMRGKMYFMIPREFLIRNGKPFWVTGTFTRSGEQNR
jgi:hypothetical protein